MPSTNFWSVLDTDVRELPAELPAPTDTVTSKAHASKDMMREMALASEIPFETGTTNGDSATGNTSKADEQNESTPDEASEDAKKAEEYAAAKKAKKAAKKLRQKIKAGKIAPDALSQEIVVADGTKSTQDEASTVQDSDASTYTNGSVGDPAQSIASPIDAVNQVQVHPDPTEESDSDDVWFDARSYMSDSDDVWFDARSYISDSDDVFFDARSYMSDSDDVFFDARSSLSDPADIDELTHLDATAHGYDDGNLTPAETAAPTPVQLDARPKNTVANGRKKENKKKAYEARIQAEVRERLRKERIQAGLGLGALLLVFLVLWILYTCLLRC
ncbi:hypothetical protein P171DRAFT_493213 [Karstenula rhodostoma CBS 690.94]|uniref:Uncharacterized protein n=1 Tax=Karstenula rhodostoma CBS 690.94 TaxID=1392251 RepID=A0A9P4PUS1_9PLEO|nr:hypothetical protein P171DRAFT_493213 [Karstenula rhodostoma CBS 690.94]